MALVMDMKKRWRTPFCLVLCCGALWFLADAAHCRAAVEEALSLCARSVIPSLFPFLVISSLLLAMGFGDLTASVLSGLMEPLFRIGGPGSAALVLGLLGGYPIGAKTAGELYQSHALSRQEAERLLTFCNNCSPVFLISVLGSGIFGSVRAGVWLLLIHVGSALLVGLLFRGTSSACSQDMSRSCTFQAISPVQAFVSAVDGALRSVLSVCAFVTFFYVLSRPLSSLGGPAGALLVGMTELFSLTPLLTPDRFGFILAAGAAGWGGLSVLCQTAAALEGSGLRLRYCLVGKALQGLFSALLAAALSGYVLG